MSSLQFQISVEPALSLADTRITAQTVGPKISGEPMDNDGSLWRVAKLWAEAHYPHSTMYAIGADWVPTRLVIVNDQVAPKVELDPIAIGHRIVDNRDSDIAQSASVDFSAEVTGTTSIETSREVTAGVTFTVGVEVGSEFAKASASTSYSLSATVGQSQSKSQSFSVSTTEGTSITVPPRQIALIVGLVSKGVLTFDVDVAFRPETYGHCGIGTENASGTRRWDTVNGTDLAPYCAGVRPSDVFSIRLPFASEVTTKVVAPLASTEPSVVADALAHAVGEYQDNVRADTVVYRTQGTQASNG